MHKKSSTSSPSPPISIKTSRKMPYERSAQNAAMTLHRQHCLICGEFAVNKHFGVLSCNACAAFFRRTVSHQKTYFCRRGKNCSFEKTEPRHMCRFCRFQCCIRSGMVISAVLAPLELVKNRDSEGSFLAKIVLARRANFINRSRATVQVYGGHDLIIRTANKYKFAKAVFYAIHAETIVIRNFLDYCDLSIIDLDLQLRKGFFFSWMLCENLLMTTKNVGFRTDQYFFVDESYVTSDYDQLLNYYRTDPTVRYPETVAWHAVLFFRETIALSAKFHEARLDDEEKAALSFIFVTNTASKSMKTPNENVTLFDGKVQQIMKELKVHYENNYNDVAIRMGNIILLLTEFQRVRHLFDEHLIMQQLNGKKTVFDKLHSEASS